MISFFAQTIVFHMLKMGKISVFLGIFRKIRVADFEPKSNLGSKR